VTRQQQRPATVEELRARAAAVISARMQAGRPLTAKWLGEAAAVTDGGALKFLREHADAGRLARRSAPGGPAPYRDAWTAAVPVEDRPATKAPAVEDSTTTGPGHDQDPARGVFRVLVTGSRSWTDAAAITGALAELHRQYGDRLVVVHGACRTGADRIADGWARRHGVTTETHPADWAAGRGAGPARNAAMVATSPDVCLAFIRDQSPGATGCADAADRAGIPTSRHSAGSVEREPAAEAAPAAPELPTQAAQPTAQLAERHSAPSAEASAQLPDVTDVLFADLDLVGR
jgi:hypothetical protein